MNKNHSNFKNLVFEKFFEGEVIAKGHLILFYPKKINKDLYVVFKGTFKNNKLKLNEKYFENEKKIIRNWVFEKKSNTFFIGKEKNVSGNILVHINRIILK